MDRISPERRSANMSRIRGKDTGPEMVVRRALHRLGYRFRLHRKDLPGRPDLVLPRHRVAIFVHGCFWHRHPGCRLATWPRTNAAFWAEKFERNVARDIRASRELEAMGWKVMTLWECELRDDAALERLLLERLPPRRDADPAGEGS